MPGTNLCPHQLQEPALQTIRSVRKPHPSFHHPKPLAAAQCPTPQTKVSLHESTHAKQQRTTLRSLSQTSHNHIKRVLSHSFPTTHLRGKPFWQRPSTQRRRPRSASRRHMQNNNAQHRDCSNRHLTIHTTRCFLARRLKPHGPPPTCSKPFEDCYANSHQATPLQIVKI